MAITRRFSGTPFAVVQNRSGAVYSTLNKASSVDVDFHEIEVDTNNTPSNLGYYQGHDNTVIDVGWGDGDFETNSTAGVIAGNHAYSSNGVYRIRFVGSSYTPRNNDNGNGLQDIIRWGICTATSNTNVFGGFRGTNNLTTISATDSPNWATGNLQLRYWFFDSANFNADLSGWVFDLGQTYDLENFVEDATVFNQPLGAQWGAISITDLSGAFNSCSAFNQDLSAWDMSNCTTLNRAFGGCVSLNQTFSWDVGRVTNFNQCFASCGALIGGLNTWNVGENVTGNISFREFMSGTDNFVGDISTDSVNGYWDMSQVRDMYRFMPFSGVSNPTMSGWDVSSCINFTQFCRINSGFQGNGLDTWTLRSTGTPDIVFDSAFSSCSVFNPDLSSWDVNQVRDMGSMFSGCTIFNSNLDSWNVTGCNDFISMFNGARAFNSGLGSGVAGSRMNGWNVNAGGTISLAGIFTNCNAFNQELTSWNVSSIENFSSVFSNCISFNNGGIGGVGVGLDSWDVSSGLSFAGMFQSTPFAHTLESWDVSNATNMSGMFRSSSSVPQAMFASWNVSNVTNFSYMFDGQVSGFIPQVAGWNTGSATNMQKMFAKKLSFELDLSGWNTSLVQNMSYMFESTAMSNGSSFSGTVSGWSIASLTNAAVMFNQAGPGTTAYDQILDITTGWASQATIQSGVSFSAGSSTYTAGGNAEAGRNLLTGTYGWTITDGGPV